MKKLFLFLAAMMTATVMNLQAATIQPKIVGMYEQWNIVLDVKSLSTDLAKCDIEAVLDPKNVSWYIVNGDVDQVDPITGVVTDDLPAVPFSGFYHTEDKAMDNTYYAVVYVPEAQAIIGKSHFQSNVVFVKTPSGTGAPVRKEVRNGQLVIIRDGVMYNAQGGKL